jgi:hypothetical protein
MAALKPMLEGLKVIPIKEQTSGPIIPLFSRVELPQPQRSKTRLVSGLRRARAACLLPFAGGKDWACSPCRASRSAHMQVHCTSVRLDLFWMNHFCVRLRIPQQLAHSWPPPAPELQRTSMARISLLWALACVRRSS